MVGSPTSAPAGQDVDADASDVAVDDAAGVDAHAQASPLDLAAGRLLTQVLDELEHLADTGRADRVPARDQPATRVHRRAAASDRRVARQRGRTGPTRVVEAQRLEGVELLGAGGVVQLDQVDVVRTDRR